MRPGLHQVDAHRSVAAHADQAVEARRCRIPVDRPVDRGSLVDLLEQFQNGDRVRELTGRRQESGGPGLPGNRHREGDRFGPCEQFRAKIERRRAIWRTDNLRPCRPADAHDRSTARGQVLEPRGHGKEKPPPVWLDAAGFRGTNDRLGHSVRRLTQHEREPARRRRDVWKLSHPVPVYGTGEAFWGNAEVGRRQGKAKLHEHGAGEGGRQRRRPDEAEPVGQVDHDGGTGDGRGPLRKFPVLVRGARPAESDAARNRARPERDERGIRLSPPCGRRTAEHNISGRWCVLPGFVAPAGLTLGDDRTQQRHCRGARGRLGTVAVATRAFRIEHAGHRDDRAENGEDQGKGRAGDHPDHSSGDQGRHRGQ